MTSPVCQIPTNRQSCHHKPKKRRTKERGGCRIKISLYLIIAFSLQEDLRSKLWRISLYFDRERRWYSPKTSVSGRAVLRARQRIKEVEPGAILLKHSDRRSLWKHEIWILKTCTHTHTRVENGWFMHKIMMYPLQEEGATWKRGWKTLNKFGQPLLFLRSRSTIDTRISQRQNSVEKERGTNEQSITEN